MIGEANNRSREGGGVGEGGAGDVRGRRKSVRRVVADAGAATAQEGPLIEAQGEGKARDVVEYDWEKEWYPMYLVAEMPTSAPLGLTVFDKKLVLFYDGNGELNCFEDRCPHRFSSPLVCML